MIINLSYKGFLYLINKYLWKYLWLIFLLAIFIFVIYFFINEYLNTKINVTVDIQNNFNSLLSMKIPESQKDVEDNQEKFKSYISLSNPNVYLETFNIWELFGEITDVENTIDLPFNKGFLIKQKDWLTQNVETLGIISSSYGTIIKNLDWNWTSADVNLIINIPDTNNKFDFHDKVSQYIFTILKLSGIEPKEIFKIDENNYSPLLEKIIKGRRILNINGTKNCLSIEVKKSKEIIRKKISYGINIILQKKDELVFQ